MRRVAQAGCLCYLRLGSLSARAMVQAHISPADERNGSSIFLAVIKRFKLILCYFAMSLRDALATISQFFIGNISKIPR
jgi:hypothetical protein